VKYAITVVVLWTFQGPILRGLADLLDRIG